MLGTELTAARESRIEWWGRVIARQRSAQVTLAQFCRELGVTPRVFYYWRKRVREAEAASSGRVATAASWQPTTARGEAVGFVPVSIIGAGATTELEIELGNGCAIRLKGPVDSGLLQAAITAAGQLGGSGRGGS